MEATFQKKEEILKKWEKNPMLKPRLAKVVVNFGVGASGERLEKGVKVLETISGQTPVKIRAKKTIRDFGIRKKEPIACKVTLRGEKAKEFLRKALEAVDFKIKASSFDDYGNVSFGIKEHINLPGVRYDPDLGIFGMDVCISIERPGYRVKRRKIRRARVPERHRVHRDEAMIYLMEEFGVKIET